MIVQLSFRPMEGVCLKYFKTLFSAADAEYSRLLAVSGVNHISSVTCSSLMGGKGWSRYPKSCQQNSRCVALTLVAVLANPQSNNHYGKTNSVMCRALVFSAWTSLRLVSLDFSSGCMLLTLSISPSGLCPECPVICPIRLAKLCVLCI